MTWKKQACSCTIIDCSFRLSILSYECNSSSSRRRCRVLQYCKDLREHSVPSQGFASSSQWSYPDRQPKQEMRTAAGKAQDKAQGKARQGKARQGYGIRELTSAPTRRGWSKILNVFCFVKAQPHTTAFFKERQGRPFNYKPRRPSTQYTSGKYPEQAT
jgi:hypothetical protein